MAKERLKFKQSRGKFSVIFAVNTPKSSVQIYSDSFNQTSGVISGDTTNTGESPNSISGVSQELVTQIHACAVDHNFSHSIFHDPSIHDRDTKFEDALRTFYEWFWVNAANKQMIDRGEVIPTADDGSVSSPDFTHFVPQIRYRSAIKHE